VSRMVVAFSVAALMLAGCFRSHLDPERQPTNVLIVLDRSGSMGHPWDERSKWDAANDALVGAIEAEDKELRVGTLLFPEPGADACGVREPDGAIELTPADDFVRSRREGSWVDPGGSTPMEAAFRTVDATIDRVADEGLLEYERFLVLLLTDGVPNCDSDEEVLRDLAAGWRARGVEVHALGLPGSEEASELLRSISTSTTTVDRGERGEEPTGRGGAASGGGDSGHREPEDPDDLEEDVGALI